MAWGVAAWAAGPVLDFAYPAGGAPGSEFEVEVGGSTLDEVATAVVSGGGVALTYLGPAKRTERDKKGAAVSTVVPGRLRFKAVIDKGAPPGLRALRVSTAYRLSEPVGFEVSNLPEQSKAVTNRADEAVCDVAELPVCLNGRVHGQKGDRYRFQGTKGMTVVALTDPATLPPGAFLPVLRFTDAAGKPCEGVAVYEAADAPVAVFEVPEDGLYALEVAPASEVVGDTCVYRVKLGELPLITALSPSGAQEGDSLNVRLEGVNLPQKRVRLFTGGKNSALCLQTLTEGAYALPSLRFDLAAEAAAPDFRVTMTPASLHIPGEGSALVSIQVERLNGFAGEVRVGLDFPPLSIASEGGVIPAGRTNVLMTVSTDGVRYPRTVFGLELVATAEINGQSVKRAVVPVRPCKDGGRLAFGDLAARANVTTRAMRLSVASPKTVVSVPAKAPVPLTVQSAGLAAQLGGSYEPVVVYPPAGFTVEGVQPNNKQGLATILLKADPAALPAGSTGQLILGCVKKEDPKRELQAVTQSVPFVVK
jgi:hypothetical protein